MYTRSICFRLCLTILGKVGKRWYVVKQDSIFGNLKLATDHDTQGQFCLIPVSIPILYWSFCLFVSNTINV